MVVAVSNGMQLQWLYDKDVDMAHGFGQLIDVLLKPPSSTGNDVSS